MTILVRNKLHLISFFSKSLLVMQANLADEIEFILKALIMRLENVFANETSHQSRYSREGGHIHSKVVTVSSYF